MSSDSNALTPILSLSCLSMMVCVVLCAAIIGYNIWSLRTLRPRKKKKPKATSRPAAKTCGAYKGNCAYTTRQLIDNVWQCPLGYEENHCNWSDGADRGKLQCKACGQNSPYAAYGVANPNCPAGFLPCNDTKFNYGDLLKNEKGEYYYKSGFGVDDPAYDDVFGSDYLGGSITLNRGKWGGTDAHPEVFAKSCCAYGNSTDDPQRDKANKTIKIATAVVSGVVDIASIIAVPFTGGMSFAGAMALHGATTAVSVGTSQAGQAISAKCGGPTVKFKQGPTKGRNYYFKGPYNDVAHGKELTERKMRGTPGMWYAASNGCPLKWLQYIGQEKKQTAT